MTVTLALLPSPLLGPSVWAPVGRILRSRGWTVAGTPPFGTVADYRGVLDTWEVALPSGPDYVLVPHSNAGLYLPALGERRHVAGQVFVDAALPPASGTVPLAAEPLYRMLEPLADGNGLLPPWTRWWTDEQVARLFPDAPTRVLIESEQPRLPLSYFAERMPVQATWTGRPSAYLAFGETYSGERGLADSWGWPVRTLAGGHLCMLTAPDLVASAVEDLLEGIGIVP